MTGSDRLVDALPDAVISVDADLVIEAANEAAAQMTGFPVEELVGAKITALIDPRGRDGRALWPQGWPRSARMNSVRGVPEQHVRLRHPSGSDVEALATGRYRRDAKGKFLGAVYSLRSAARRNHQAAAGIEIVSTVSHELRSPLTSVKGYTSLLLNRWGRLPDEQRRVMMEQINHDADRVTRLITELLDITRLETGRLFLRREMVRLPEVTERVVTKVAIEYADIDVTSEFAEDVPAVYADPDKIEQVLTNLVENACKYASRIGIRVEAGVDNGFVWVQVSDQGEGIPPEDLPRVFTKFFRRDEGRPTGSGLGLWISRGLVEAHGGQLSASSIPSEGSSFRFTLPTDAFERLHG